MRSAEPFTLEDAADDAAALLGQLGTGPVIVVGYSMGGPVGLLLARRHPGTVAALVMQATALQARGTARQRLAWRPVLSVVELSLRLGAGVDLAERVVRQAVEEQPGLGATSGGWPPSSAAGSPANSPARHAVSRHDARPWAGQLRLHAAMLITTRDRVVRPSRQRELAQVLQAQVIEIDADHDLPLVNGQEYARLTRLAVDTAAAAAQLTIAT